MLTSNGARKYGVLTLCGLGALFLLLAGCQMAGSPSDELPFTTIDAGQNSAIDLEEPQLFRALDQREWERFWALHRGQGAPPKVDFSRDMVIAVVDRAQPTGGFAIEIVRLALEGQRLLVHVVRKAPGSNCVTPQVITSPFHIVLATREEAPTELSISTETYNC